MRTNRQHTNRRANWRSLWLLVAVVGLLLLQTAPVHAQSVANDGGSVTFSVDGGKDQLTTSIKIVLLMTVLTLAPSLVVLTTSFTRILIVLGFLRQAIGTQQTPSNQILAGIALFLTIVVMMPVFEEINETALQPYLKAQEEVTGGAEASMSERQALDAGIIPLKRFMLAQTRQKDLAMFMDFAKVEMPLEPEQLSLSVVVPSFLTSELKTAFQMGFMLYLPFLVVDMVIASVLMSMGMMMLPPILISLPFKILLFVLVDGWHLVTRSLVAAFAASS
jgi:flagellar biosynthesis protein FliP